jgi:hypothetical protein
MRSKFFSTGFTKSGCSTGYENYFRHGECLKVYEFTSLQVLSITFGTLEPGT